MGRKFVGVVVFAISVLFLSTAASGAVGIGTTVSKDQSSSSLTVVTPAFSTSSANQLLLAFVATDGPSSGTNTVVNTVTGAGLTWVLVRRTNTQAGTTEIWRAFASAALSAVTVTATLSKAAASSLVVMTFTGVDTSGTNGSGAVGATGSGNANPGAPTATLVTTRANSWVFGVGNDWDKAASRTAGATQTVVHQYLATVGDTYWVQQQNAPTPTVGTGVMINDTLPTGDRYNLTTCEVLPAANVIPAAPVITSTNSTAFVVGKAGSFTMTASGSPAPTFTEMGALPTGVTLSTAGVLSGTPAAGTSGSYPIAVTAQNGVSPNGTQNFTLTVNAAPAITSGSSTVFVAGTLGSFTVTATGSPTPAISEAGALPSGVGFDPVAGVLSGTPATSGSYPITFTAQNGVSPNAVQNFTLTVNPAPTAPVITSAISTAFVVGKAGSFTLTATGSPSPTFSETGALPAGVTLSTAGVLSGTPAAGTSGSYPIAVTAQNGVSPNGMQNFTLTVNAAPAITSGNSTVFVAGTLGSFTVTATGSPTPTISEAGALPSGVGFDPVAGVLSGTPATSGSYPITFTAQNGVSPNAMQSFTLTVNPAPTAPVITSAISATFVVGAAGSFTMTATGSPVPTFTETGALPTGVTLSTAGVLSGTPAAGTSGSYPIAVTAQNGVSPDGTQSFTLTVNAAPAITSGSSTVFVAGTFGSFTVTATGSPTPAISEADALPSGVGFDPVAGVLSGTPATSGSYPITFTAQNGVSPNAMQSFTLTVNPAPAAPVITSAISATFVVGAAGSFTVIATGPPTPILSEMGTLPPGVNFNAATGVLAGTPAAGSAGPYPVTFMAQNGVSPDAMQSFTLTVNPAATTWTISGTVSPSAGGAGATLSLVGPASATATADNVGNYSFTGLTNGDYLVIPSNAGFAFNPASQDVAVNGANRQSINFAAQAAASAPISVDVTTFKDQSSSAKTVVTSAFSTTAANELLLAMVGLDVSTSSGTNNSVTGVTGAGLTWVLVQRTNTQRGSAEIWRAFATTALTNVTVTATYSISAVSSMTVMSFKNVNTSGTNGSGAIGAIGSGNGTTGTPTASLMTLGNNSLVVGTGEDWNAAPTVTAAANQTVVHILALSGLNTFWAQRQNATTPTSGTTAMINDTAPSGDMYNMAICEILPVAGGTVTSSLSGTVTPAAGGTNATLALTGAATVSTTTNASGAYVFTGLANGSYTITPSNAGYVFSPGKQTIPIAGAGVTGANFTATPLGQTFTISGNVTAAGTGAVMTLSGNESTTATADSSGNYMISALPSGAYVVTPGKPGYTFNPASLPVTINGASVVNVNFGISSATVAVSISPATALLSTGGTQQFTATVTGNANTAVTWSATSGTVSSSGFYTAPGTAGTYTVKATSQADATKSASASVTVTTAALSTVLLGDQNVETQADLSLSLGQAEAFQTTANSSGSVQSLVVYLDSSSTVSTLVAGLYADSGGHPGTLLAQGSSTQLVPGAWNTIAVSSQAVAAGTSYWIAILGTNTGQLAFRHGAGGACVSETNTQGSFTSLPSPWGSGTGASNCATSAFADSTKVLFYDTFAGTALNLTNWTVISRHGEYSQGETECNTDGLNGSPQTVFVNNGLSIVTSAQTWSCGDSTHAPTSFPYITGDIQWKNLNFSTGTVEISAKFPPYSSLWPATWLLNSKCQQTNPLTGETGVGGCPNLGQSGYTEIDMTECYSSNCKLNVANPNFTSCDLSYAVDTSAFHTYKTVWTSGTSGSIKQYVDNSNVATCNQNLSAPMFLIIQTQTGGVSGTPNPSQLPATFSVKYVKVTQP